MRVKTLSIGLVIAISLAAALLGVIAYAQGSSTELIAVGNIPHSEFFAGPATVTVRKLTINPGASLAWHYHPGYAYNVIKSGTLTVEDGCGGEETFIGTGNPTGNPAFEETDGRVHRAKNLTTEPVVVYNTFVVPEGKPTTVNIPGNERRCGPPENVDECKNEGWLNFNHPQIFINQGQCIDFVKHRPRNTIPVPQDPLN